jgi:hypothetical protein
VDLDKIKEFIDNGVKPGIIRESSIAICRYPDNRSKVVKYLKLRERLINAR